MTDRLHRLHRALIDALDRRGHDPGQPVKVAEIHEELVPYRTARSLLDVHVRADYEHTLLRLLAGEESLARVEPEEARHELRREVDKPYPDVALYRKFAASDVFLSPPATDDSREPPDADEPEGAPEAEDAAGTGETGASRGVATPVPGEADRALPARPDEEAGTGPAVGDRAAEEPAADDPGGEATAPPGDCVFCGRALPADRSTRFCPLCGGDQRLEPCARCGEPLEPGWRFCIACGLETGAG